MQWSNFINIGKCQTELLTILQIPRVPRPVCIGQFVAAFSQRWGIELYQIWGKYIGSHTRSLNLFRFFIS